MPRDANGNYSLPSGNPVVTGTTIESAWSNLTMDDIKQALTDSLDRYGRGGMAAPFRFVDGTQSAPGISWSSELSTGFYRAASSDMRAAVSGVSRMRWTGVGVDVWDPTGNAGAGAWASLVNTGGLGFLLSTGGTMTGQLTLPGGGTGLNAATVDQVNAVVPAHVALPDPHAQYALESVSISTANSLTGGGDLSATRTLSLVNDAASPGNSFYYGTNASGVKGYFALPAAPTGYLPLTGGTMTGQIVLPGTGTGSQAATVTQATNAANSAVSTHVAASNPHTGYLLKTGGTLTGDLVLGGGSAAQFFNAANTVSKSLVIGSADELVVSGRGGVANWNSATLTSAQMYVGATGSAPASAAAGTIYFEY